MKKIIALFVGTLLAVPLAQAQTETGTSAGARALDQARSGAISAGRAPTTVSVTDYKTASGKEVTVIEEEDKWWSVNASTGWDSLYMFRGANLLGNGNGLYWLGGDLGISPWEDGNFVAGFWYGVGSWWNGANRQYRYGEVNVFADYTHSFGALDLTVGWIYYWYPTSSQAQNEILFGASYDIEIGSVTITPNTTYYYNVGPQLGTPGGVANGGSSYWTWGVTANVPVAYDGAVALEPSLIYGINFGFNNRTDDPTTDPATTTRFNGGNNIQATLGLPIQFTSWFGVAPYIAYSYQWQSLAAGKGTGTGYTAVNTWWAGVSANFSF